MNSICYMDLPDTSAVTNFYHRILYHMVCDIFMPREDATVAERIRIFRLRKNLSCKTLAKRIGMSRYAIMYYENNQSEPLLEDLKKIAIALNVESDRLYDEYYRFLDYPYTDRIKQIRAENNLLQRELGAMLGLTRRAIERWEHGKNTVSRETWEQLILLKLL